MTVSSGIQIKALSSLLITIFLLSALVLPRTIHSPVEAYQSIPRFEPVECSEWDIQGAAECGYVIVPENHRVPDSSTIRLAVAVYRARDRGDALPDPVVYLFGGPGNAGLRWASSIAANFPRDRDVVIFDQRGVGRSEPNLNCWEIDDLHAATLDQPYHVEGAELVWYAAIEACRDRLLDEGIDLASYTTTHNAADVDDIRVALGYDQIILYGVSYGTFLAQYVMRHYPATIRAVVLDGVLPVEVKILEADPINSQQSFVRLFERCAADAQCSVSYPDLEAEFLALVDHLNAEPLALRKSDPFTGQIHTVLLDGDRLIQQTFMALGSPDSMSQFPAAIHDLARGKSSRFHALMFIGWPEITSEGMMLSTLCADVVPHNDLTAMEMAIASIEPPQVRDFYQHQLPLASLANYPYDCAHWIAFSESPAANDPIISDIPTLVLSGELDDVTPPAWGELVAHHLSRSHAFVIPGGGHVVIGQACANQLIADFLADPLTPPGASCLETARSAF